MKGEEDIPKQMVDRNTGIEMHFERYKERERIEHAVNKSSITRYLADFQRSRSKFWKSSCLLLSIVKPAQSFWKSRRSKENFMQKSKGWRTRMPFWSKYLFVLFRIHLSLIGVFWLYLFGKMEGSYKEAEGERDGLKKPTQVKFGKLSNNHKAGEKLVWFTWVLLSLLIHALLYYRTKRPRILSVNSPP